MQGEFDVLCAEHAVDMDRASDAAAAADLDLVVNNPLSTDTASPYAKYFEGAALREEISRDLERLHPGDAFFERSPIQRLMSRILFIWARANPELSYRQGMHELLAPIVSVLWLEAEEAAQATDAPNTPCRQPTTGPEAEDEVRALLGHLVMPAHVEAAAWHLFSRMMASVRGWFEAAPRLKAPDKVHGKPQALPQLPATPLQRKCAQIQDELLGLCDPALHLRIRALSIEPQLYLLRWLRLLFGREFHIEDVKVLWDAIFAFGAESQGSSSPTTALALVDYLAVAMLMYVRNDLLAHEYTMAMKRLLKFPPLEDVLQGGGGFHAGDLYDEALTCSFAEAGHLAL